MLLLCLDAHRYRTDWRRSRKGHLLATQDASRCAAEIHAKLRGTGDANGEHDRYLPAMISGLQRAHKCYRCALMVTAEPGGCVEFFSVEKAVSDGRLTTAYADTSNID